MKCDNCQHMDYQKAAEAKMKFWGVCKIGNKWEFMGRNSNCKKFRAADEETIEKRQEWLAGR